MDYPVANRNQFPRSVYRTILIIWFIICRWKLSEDIIHRTVQLVPSPGTSDWARWTPASWQSWRWGGWARRWGRGWRSPELRLASPWLLAHWAVSQQVPASSIFNNTIIFIKWWNLLNIPGRKKLFMFLQDRLSITVETLRPPCRKNKKRTKKRAVERFGGSLVHSHYCAFIGRELHSVAGASNLMS